MANKPADTIEALLSLARSGTGPLYINKLQAELIAEQASKTKFNGAGQEVQFTKEEVFDAITGRKSATWHGRTLVYLDRPPEVKKR